MAGFEPTPGTDQVCMPLQLEYVFQLRSVYHGSIRLSMVHFYALDPIQLDNSCIKPVLACASKVLDVFCDIEALRVAAPRYHLLGKAGIT